MAIEQFPHCDQNILHEPGSCQVCDMHPDWQELRILWGINFTGKEDPDKAPCPSERLRPPHIAHEWPGNRPTEVPFERLGPPERPSALDRILNEEDSF